jgi:NAD(P)-dependent dehydrogenase (short-subunit alcohol dehydrogenase family)
LCFYLGYGEGTPCEIHHIRRAGQRKNAPVIPLCPEHHRGNLGVHGLGRKAFEREYDITEEDLLKQVVSQVPMHRFVHPEEIADLALYLASDESSYITGITIDVSGGRYLR